MPLNLPLIEYQISKLFKQIKESQLEALTIEIAANYVAGRTAGEKHKSTRPLNSEEIEDDGLTLEESLELAALTALFAGYITEFNDRTKKQIIENIRVMNQEGRPREDIKNYVDDVLEGRENVVIDNVGKKRTEIYVDKDLNLSEVIKTVSKPFFVSTLVYASLTAENAAHAGYEEGRKQAIKKQSEKWVFVGPVDERARPWHAAIVGEVYEYGSRESAYAEHCLREPRCRHRAHIFYDDPEKDTPKETWDRLKKKAGLYWDKEAAQWKLKEELISKIIEIV